MRKLFVFIGLAWSFFCFSEKKEVIDFQRPIDIEGQIYNIKNSCLPPLESSKKLFNDFLSLQETAIDGFLRYEKVSKETANLWKTHDTLKAMGHKVINDLDEYILSGNILKDVSAQLAKNFEFAPGSLNDLNNLSEKGDHLMDLYNKSMSKYNALQVLMGDINHKIYEYDNKLSKGYLDFWKNQRSLLQTQKMFFLSFRMGKMSLYSIQTLSEGTEKQLSYLDKFIQIQKSKKTLIKSLISLQNKKYPIVKQILKLRKEWVQTKRSVFKKLFAYNPGIKEKVKKYVEAARQERVKAYNDVSRGIASKDKKKGGVSQN